MPLPTPTRSSPAPDHQARHPNAPAGTCPAGDLFAGERDVAHLISEPAAKVEGAILVVDDEEPVRTVVGRILEDRGFAVMTASDAYEALDVFGQHANGIALVLLDMTMPGLSGHETSKALRRIREDVRVPKVRPMAPCCGVFG